ncbi:MAG: phosphoserine phosphatase SerB [Aeromonadales bacterium]|nr:phosphoserine phosphatase SerB [Aeromonadales bacterium]
MSLVYIVKKDKEFNSDSAVEKVAAQTGLTLNILSKKELQGHVGVLCKTDNDNAHELCKKAVLDNKFDFDVWANKSFPTLKKKGQVCLDMDMTSVQIEGIDEIARRLNVFDKVSEITSKAMNGGLDFAQSLTLRVSMLKDGDASVIEDVKKIMTETDGLDVLMKTVSDNGWVKGICSGGFEQLICVLEKKYNLDMVCANSLEIKDGRLTGKVDKRIVDAAVKREGVFELQKKAGIDKDQIIVLGDGANDLKMIEVAALGIAYHAKPLVQQTAPFSINYSDLTAVALLLEMMS